MRLLPHILRKDVRHFYPEILVNVALLAAFVWSEPSQWAIHGPYDSRRLVALYVKPLLPLAWFVLISRLVHDEVLVGDRQFWITRPYRWTTLLLEKALFLFLFLQLPLLLAQMCLLHRAGLMIGPALTGLLLAQFTIAVVYVLPLWAIGVVSRSFSQHAIFLIGGAIYVIAVLGFHTWVAALGASENRITPPYVNGTMFLLAVLSGVTVVLVMYGRRRVLAMRVLLLGLPLAMVFLSLCAPTGALVRHVYAAASGPEAFVFDTNPTRQQGTTGEPAVSGGNVSVQLPVMLTGLRADGQMGVKGVQLTLRSAEGAVWRSPFQMANNLFDPGSVGSIAIAMPIREYRRLQSGLVQAELRFAVELYLLRPAEAVSVPASGLFRVPGNGACEVKSDGTELVCRFPPRSGVPSQMKLEEQDSPCSASVPRKAYVHEISGASDALQLDLDPVTVQTVALQSWFRTGNGSPAEMRGQSGQDYLCPGAHVSFAPVQTAGREELVMTQKGVSLPLYVVQKSGSNEPQENTR